MQGKLAFAAILALGLTELGLIAFAVVPDVGPEYRAYYIDRTTGCLPRQAPGAYKLGTVVHTVSTGTTQPFDDVLVCGFGVSEPTGTWMRGREARLRFAVTRPRTDLQLQLEAGAPPGPERRLTVTANGHRLGETLFDDAEPRRLTFPIPSSVPLTTDGTLEIELNMVYPTPPTPQESRRYSMVLQSLRLAPDGME